MHGLINPLFSAAVALAVILSAIPAAAQEPDLDALLAGMSLDQKIGQMHIIGFTGRELTPDTAEFLRQSRIGGYFFQPLNNFTFPEELARLTAALQDAAADLPLFIALDQEGGVAAPVHYMMGATPTPGNRALGASGREEDTYDAYKALGNDMAACGANLNFAPAIDVLLRAGNPDYTIRAFSSSVALNTRLAPAAVSGLQDAQVLACAKHFPGLVTFAEDTHAETVHITLPAEELDGMLDHFRAAIAAGTDMIMTCHAVVDAWDALYPVTLSKQVVTGKLRDELGYQGLVITDSMGMGAITKQHSREMATVLAITAGCDIVLQVSPDVEEFRARVAAVREAVELGRIPQERIDESVRRILEAKARRGLFSGERTAPEEVFEKMAPPALVKANERAALNGIVLVRDDAQLLPLPLLGKKIVIVCPPSIFTRAGKGVDQIPAGYTLGHFIRRVVPEAIEVPVDTVPTEEEATQALAQAETSDILIIAALLANQSPDQVALIRNLLDLQKPTVLLSLGTPADLAPFPDAPTAIAVNSPAPVSTAAATRVLFGEAEAGGSLPMAIDAGE
ncbi:MAG: glycoside hydrolase family 3 C-terminal domain-containing protein [Candidatus Hydrogenedentes bacterium]|nr:glycoside hydrolase family 3 C-terminal domain-containing protein [Candidatus Hydrogenedentota bacterium]